MIFANDKISLRQLQILIILDAFSTGMIVLPRKLSILANQDAYLIAILSTFFAMAYMYLIMSVGRLFPFDNFVSYTKKIFNRPFAIIISIGFILKIFIGLTFELRSFGEIINQTLLYKTPVFIVMGTTLLISSYAASKGIETRARLGEFLIGIVTIFSLLVIGLLTFNADFSNLKPFLTTEPKTFLFGSFTTSNSFIGLEYGLLIYPFLLNKIEARKSAVSSVFIYGAILTIFTILSLAHFGDMSLKRQLWPVLELINTIHLPGSFIERQDAFVISFWFIGVFTTVTSGLFFSAILFKDLLKFGQHSIYIGICSVILLFLTISINSISTVLLPIQSISLWLNIFYLFIFPILCLAFAHLKKLKVGGLQ